MIYVVSSIRIGEALVVTGETGRLYATSRPIHFQIKPQVQTTFIFNDLSIPNFILGEFGGIWGV
jgi:hypothetical protein